MAEHTLTTGLPYDVIDLCDREIDVEELPWEPSAYDDLPEKMDELDIEIRAKL